MPPRKLLRASAEEEDTPARTLPGDLLLEIVARADAETVVRCAACCKPLRRDILSPGFIRRLCNDTRRDACLLGFLHAYNKAYVEPPPLAPFSLAHPATPAATSFSEKHIVRPMSCGTGAALLSRYVPLTSRRGLVVLRRRHVYRRGRKDVCVFDPVAGGDRALFFPWPPDIKQVSAHMYVPLTAADGVGRCSFLLLAAALINFGVSSYSIKVQTVSADRKWGPVVMANLPRPPGSSLRQQCCGAVVLGTLIHWLMYDDQCSRILTYDFGTTTAGWIELPPDGPPKGCKMVNLHLTSSPDGSLRLLVSDRLTVSVWLLLSTGGGGWERQAVIHTEATVPRRWWPDNGVLEFKGSGARSGAVLLQPSSTSVKDRFVVLDLETKEMRMVIIRKNDRCNVSFPCEVDLMSCLSTMKSFC